MWKRRKETKKRPGLTHFLKKQCFHNLANPIVLLLKKWAIPGLFFYFRLFNTQLTVNKCSINNKKFADDWIRTTDFWYRKPSLYQLSHNHCPIVLLFIMNRSFLTTFCVSAKSKNKHHMDGYWVDPSAKRLHTSA